MHYGAEATVIYRFLDNFGLLSSLEYVYPVNLDTRKALPFSPPLSVVSELYYHNTDKKFRIGMQVNYTASQEIVAINESPTDGYTVFNISAQKSFNIGRNEIIALIAVRNLTDKYYLNHLSYYRRLNIPEQGRNLIFSVKIPFKTNSINNV
ncbi:MAG: TonB-dependent receptor [Bacteroidetes bacterium]|nr:TonB-dependent receptor [Bacteroidota bacterium]MBS4013963.1 TonB-dependent receptor [Bacteroidota bacterium]